MGRIVASVKLTNLLDIDKNYRCDALVDTGASHMVLPNAWRERLGEMEEVRRIRLELANQEIAEGIVCGPVRLQIEGFPPIVTEVIYVEMAETFEDYEPLLGYIPLEQSQAAVDMLGHRLVPVKYLDLK